MDLQTIRHEIETDLANRAASDQEFRSQLTANPKKTIGESYGLQFGENVRVLVHEESPDEFHVVLPIQLRLSEGELSDQHLEAVAGGTGSYTVVSSSVANLNIPNPNTAGISIVNSTLTAPAGIANPTTPPVIGAGAPGAITGGTMTNVLPRGQNASVGTTLGTTYMSPSQQVVAPPPANTSSGK